MADKRTDVDLVIPMEQDMELTASKTAESVAEFMGLDPDKTAEVKLSVIEACINAFEHSQSKDQRLYVDFSLEEKELTVVMSDHGHGFYVSSALAKVKKRRAGGEQRRGWGLELMGTFMDEVDIESGQDGRRCTSNSTESELGSGSGNARVHQQRRRGKHRAGLQ